MFLLRHFRLALAFMLVALPVISHAQPQLGSTSQISLSSSGNAPQGGPSFDPGFGPNGRFLAFASSAFNIVATDTNQNDDIFIRDLKTNTVALASITTAGNQATGRSNAPAISPILPNGFYAVAFESDADDLTTIPNMSVFRSIYVRLPTLGITEIVSPGTGFTAPLGDSISPSLTAITNKDGSVKLAVVYSSDAENIAGGDSNAFRDIFLSNVLVPTSTNYEPSTFSVTQRIPFVFTSGIEPNGSSTNPKISGDGRYIVFESLATNLVSGISNSSLTQHIYRFDSQTNETILISKASDGTPGDSDSSTPSISFNGRYVVFTTTANNLFTRSAGTDSFNAVVRYDVNNGTLEQVNNSEAGVGGNGDANRPTMSANGRLIGFSDSSDMLVSSDTNDATDIFVKDMDTGTISRVSVGPNGAEGIGGSTVPAITSNSFNSLTSSIAFQSDASNLTSTGTASGNGDVFINSVTLPAPPLSDDTELDVPPDVTIKSKKVTFSAQKFAASPLPSTAAKLQIRYEFDVRVKATVGGKSRTTRTKVIQKRNVLTVVKSKGQYSVRNRVLGVNSATGKTVLKTAFTPRQEFNVP